MRITQEADYALRIAGLLAEHCPSDEARLDAGTISERTMIPQRFTLKILRKMVLGGIIRSYQGKNGGYSLSKPASEISMKDVIELIDGPVNLARCINNGHECSKEGYDKSGCRIYSIFVTLSEQLAEKLSKITIADTVDPSISMQELLHMLDSGCEPSDNDKK